MSKALNDKLLSALKRYATARRLGRSIDEPLAGIISATDFQPPSSIVESGPGIATAAQLWRWQPKPKWWQRVVREREDDQSLLGDHPSLAYLFIFHSNGFLRQAALDRISGALPNAFFVAALAWRMNDWVEEVRHSALQCAKRCFPKTDAQFLSDFLLSTARTRNTWGRWSETEKSLLVETIARDDVAIDVVDSLLTRRQGPLPSSLSLLLRYSWIDPYLERIANDASVPGVRAIALRSLIDGNAKYADGAVWRWIDKPMGVGKREPKIVTRTLDVRSDVASLICRAINDNSAVVRRVALTGIIEHALYDVLSLKSLKRCLEDPSASVRSRADFIRKKRATDC